MKIQMLRTVIPDLPFLCKPHTILRMHEIYEAKANKTGAISGLTDSGEWMGVRPGEFVFVDAPQWILDIWEKEFPDAIDRLQE